MSIDLATPLSKRNKQHFVVVDISFLFSKGYTQSEVIRMSQSNNNKEFKMTKEVKLTFTVLFFFKTRVNFCPGVKLIT